MRASKISTHHAKQDKLFYVVVTGIVYRESDGRCLILKRHEREIAHPGRFAVPGGKLEHCDIDVMHPEHMNGDVLDYPSALVQLLKRETKEETGIEIYDDIHYITSMAFVRPDETPAVLLKFAVKYKSGDVVLEENGFTEYVWVNADEVHTYPCVDGIPEEVTKTIEIFSQ